MMVTNFSACGYDRDRLSLAKSQAMALDRESLLASSTDQDDNSLSLKSIKLITYSSSRVNKLHKIDKSLPKP